MKWNETKRNDASNVCVVIALRSISYSLRRIKDEMKRSAMTTHCFSVKGSTAPQRQNNTVHFRDAGTIFC